MMPHPQLAAAQHDPAPPAAEAASSPVLAPELELVLLEFRFRAQRRVTWLRQIRAADGAFEAELMDADSPAAEAQWAASSDEACALNEHIAATRQALDSHTRSRLFELREIFGLAPREFDLLRACLAVSLDAALARVCALLHSDARRPFVTPDLVARLFEHGRCEEWNPESPLVRWRLITRQETGPAEPPAIGIDAGVREWLRGRNDLDETLTGVSRLQPLRQPFETWPVESTVTWLRAQLRGEARRPVRVRIVGQPGSGRRTFAATVSARLGMPLLAIRADEIDEGSWRGTFVRAQRHAFLERCALAWSGESMSRRTWPAEVPPFPLQFVISESRLDLPATDAGELRIEMPATRIEDRIAAWRHFAPREWDDAQVDALARRYRVQVGDIARACSTTPGDAHEAGLRVRESARGSLGSLAQLLPASFDWEDLVLPETTLETLHDLVFEARHRNEFWEQPEAQRLFPQGRGLLALFNGPPGTGKTMAAQVIASALGYDLLRIDLSTVVSKYVGETSQNLERILSRAANMDAVLLFDEADGLFGKRAAEVKEAQDKFANTDSAYLLQAIEAYPGIALLASNQKGSIDTAFLRRIRFLVEFSKPDIAQRLVIWRRVVAALAGTENAASLDAGFMSLAAGIEATGAQIKNAILGAIFVARRLDEPLGMPHLLRGLERELAKEGRTLSAKEKERLRSGGPA
ncbi:MAG TPA: ATP-binding protein [Bryobacteraceae bacterium]|nr:ATP-binding protein [Bryobacteraceae bacterium]